MSERENCDVAEERIARLAGEVVGLVPGPPLDVSGLRLSGNASFVSCFDVDSAARTAASLANLSAGVKTLDRDRVAALFSTHVEIDGRRPATWSELSGNYSTSTGGFIQFHCNFVLRVGAVHLPSVELCVVATGFGKRNTDLDLRRTQEALDFGALLEHADIWVDGYRPGALAGLGFPVERVAPGSIVVQIDAFGRAEDHGPNRPAGVAPEPGPWAGRRGFDSIIQTTTGVAAEGMVRSGREPVGSSDGSPTDRRRVVRSAPTPWKLRTTLGVRLLTEGTPGLHRARSHTALSPNSGHSE